MKTSHIVIAASGALATIAIAVIAGPVIYRDFIAAPAAELPALGADESIMAGGEPLDTEQLVGEWQVGRGSQVGYRVNEVLNGTDVTVTGRTEEITGTLSIAAPEHSDEGFVLEAAEFTVDVASIATDSANRDSYFRDQAINAGEHPTATFTLTEPVAFDHTPTAGDVEQIEATGTLLIAGTTRDVVLGAAVRSDGKTAEIAGSIPITFTDFGVDPPDFNFVKVEPEGFIEFQLTATKK